MKKVFLVLLSVVLAMQISIAHEGDKKHAEYTAPYPLIHAASHGDNAEVKRLLDTGADVNAVNKDGFTALMMAAEESHAEIVKILIAAGAE